LRRAGAIAGLVAGALGATAYAFHCPDDSVPFIAIWYGTLVALCGAVGAMLAHGFCGGDRFTSAPKREPRHLM